MRRELADLHKGSLDEGRRHRRTKGTKRLRPSKGRTVLQDARWGLIQMCGVGGSSKKIERSTRQDLRILRGGQPLLQTLKGRLLLAERG